MSTYRGAWWIFAVKFPGSPSMPSKLGIREKFNIQMTADLDQFR